MITHTVQQLTPADARRLLKTCVVNRRIRKAKVVQYAADMACGRWQFAGDPIRIDDSGHLIDGQHRLTALAGAPEDYTITFLVVEGLPSRTQEVMDQGAQRQAADQLQMAGIHNATLTAAGVRLYLEFENGTLFSYSNTATSVVTKSAIREWVEANLPTVEFVNQMTAQVIRNDARPSVAFCAALIFAHRSREECERFFDGLAHGGVGASNPITVLDKRLTSDRRRGITISTRDQLGMFVQTWNAYRAGRTLHRFNRPTGGHYTRANFPKVA